MQIETVKALFTYAIALVIIVGGLGFLYGTRLDPAATVQGLQTVVAGFIGSALTFVFTREASTQTAKQVASSVAAANGK